MFWDVESLEIVSPVGPRAKINGCVVDVVSIVPRDHVVQFLQIAMSWYAPLVIELLTTSTFRAEEYCGCWCPVERRGLNVTPVPFELGYPMNIMEFFIWLPTPKANHE